MNDRYRPPDDGTSRIMGISVRAILAGICLWAVLIHLPLLWGDFINYDDGRWIFRNPDVGNANLGFIKRLLTSIYGGAYSNPMFLTFALNWKLTPSYFGFALFNLVWLVLTILVYDKFAGLFFKDPRLRLLAVALFAVHAVKADVVGWISARCHLMAMLFFLYAFVAWQRYRDSLTLGQGVRWYIVVCLASAAAIVNKNLFSSVVVLVALYDLYQRPRWNLEFFLNKLPLLGAALLAATVPQRYASAMNRLSLTSVEHRGFEVLINDANLLVQYVLHLVVPLPSSVVVHVYKVKGVFEVSPHASLVATRLTPAASAAILIALTAAAVYLWRRYQARLPLFSLICAIITLLPVLNFVPFWVEFAYRFDWIPLAFFCVALIQVFGLLLSRLSFTGRRVAVVLMGLYLVWHSVQTFVQCTYWQSEETYWNACLRHFPDSVTCAAKLGRRLSNTDPQKSIEAYRKVDRLYNERTLKRRPVSGYMMARAYRKLGDNPRALFYYQQALLRDRLSPSWRGVSRKFVKAHEKASKNKKKDTTEPPSKRPPSQDLSPAQDHSPPQDSAPLQRSSP